MPMFFTPRKVAEMLCVDRDEVAAGNEVADFANINVAKNGGGIRPRWRISDEAFNAFLAARQTH